jgi:hypothetical protein
MHDIHNNLAPLHISNLLTYTHDIHDYNTRFSSNVNFVKHSCLNKLNNSFSRTGPRIWNSIPCDLRNFPMNKFKKTLHKVIVSIFTNEEDYVDIAMLTNRLKNITIR